MSDSKKTIASSARRFFSGTSVSRLTGLGREVSMAAVFGTMPAVAAFWMAFRFAHLLRRLFGEGALHTAFIPHFEHLRKQDPTKSIRFFYDLSVGLSLILLGIVVVAEAVLGGFLLWGNPSFGNREVLQLTMILLPAILFICLFSLNTSFLNCEHSYFLPSVAPALFNLLWIGALFLVWKMEPTLAIRKLAMMIVAAFAIQWLITLPRVYRLMGKHRVDAIPPLFGREMLKILRPFLLGMLGVAAMQINSAFDVIYARAASMEGPAYLWYALRLQQLPLALFGVGLAAALLPPISRAIERRAYGEYHNFLNYAVHKALVWMIPSTAAILALGFAGVNLVYGHGHFTREAILQTTWCLWAYGLALVPMTLVMLFAAAFYAVKNYKTPAIFACVSVVINVSLNALFVYQFHLGAVSIAIATTVSSTINALLLVWILTKTQEIKWTGIRATSAKLILSSSVAVGMTYWLSCFLPNMSREFWSQLTVLSAEFALFAASFLLCSLLLKTPIFGEYKAIPKAGQNQ
ncbi:MAG: murein biosynthesis integral membrane protein MurJ [Chlamydiales bacterium]